MADYGNKVAVVGIYSFDFSHLRAHSLDKHRLHLGDNKPTSCRKQFTRYSESQLDLNCKRQDHYRDKYNIYPLDAVDAVYSIVFQPRISTVECP